MADLGKGILAVLIAQWLDASLTAVFISRLMVVDWHSWSVFLGFRGGWWGGSTTIGVFIALVPPECTISFRLVAGIGFILLPLIIWDFGGDIALAVYSIILPYLPA